MAHYHKGITIPITIVDMLKARERSLEKLVSARILIDQAEQILNENGEHLFPYEATMRESHDRITTDLDQRLWRRAFNLTGFRQLMDTEAVLDFNKSLERNAPNFTEENIQATFLALHQDAESMFMRGIVNTFKWLSYDYKTNKSEPFRIGDKIICDGIAAVSYMNDMPEINHFGRASNRIDDIDRIFRTLDDVVFTPHQLESAINAAWQKGNVFENEYFKIKGFKKGTAHFLFKRADLLEKVNDYIAKHYGENKLASVA